MVDEAAALFKHSYGCKVHRDPATALVSARCCPCRVAWGGGEAPYSKRTSPTPT